MRTLKREMKVGGTRATEIGRPGEGEMYGDFTVGSGVGSTWAATAGAKAARNAAGPASRPFPAAAGRRKGPAAPARLIVQAQLVQTTRLPDASAYPQTLVIYKYRGERVLAGSYAGKALLAAHWGIRNGRIQSAVRDRKVGARYRLVLEPFDDHPELQSLQIVEIDGDDAFDLPLFYALSPGADEAHRLPGGNSLGR